MRRHIDPESRQARDRASLRAKVAKSIDCILLLLCLAAIGVVGSDERLLNGFRLFATLIERHARHFATGRTGNSSALGNRPDSRPALIQIK